MEQRLNNHIAYYEALASGKKNVDTFGYAKWGRTPSIEQRAEAVAEEQRKYLAHPTDRHGNKVGVSNAVFQFRTDVRAAKERKDKTLGDLAAIGRADVLQENLFDLLKIVKKLSPTQKARREAGFKIDHWNQLFNNIQLRFMRRQPGAKFGILVIEMYIIDEDNQIARISLAKVITARLDTASFTVCVDRDTFFEVIKTCDKERLSIQYRDWIDRLVVKQCRYTARLIVQPSFNNQ